MTSPHNRREFLGSALASLAGTYGMTQPPATAVSPAAPPLCVFSKHLQWLDYERMAETAAQLGFDGVDLTVRPGGHVEPADVTRDLPRAVKAVQAAGLQVPMMATAVVDPDEPASRRVLETAAELGIRWYRTGYFHFTREEALDATLDRARRTLARLAETNERLGLVGDYQNHAGEGYLGASLWDLWYVIRDLDPRWIGCQFDLRHAVAEGGSAWPVDFRRVEDRTHTLVVKDFRWKTGPEGLQAEDCPLGEGVTPFRRFFTSCLPRTFAGPITLHLEYDLGGAEHGARTLTRDAALVQSAMRRDLQVLRGWLGLR
ncbi:MAG: sugar phosphate isomerase/epimerase [Acidobacteriota bacterium]